MRIPVPEVHHSLARSGPYSAILFKNPPNRNEVQILRIPVPEVRHSLARPNIIFNIMITAS